jgi:GTP cyclohydrolase I
MNLNQKEIAKHVKQIIKLIGDDCEREGLIDTPERFAKMYAEIFNSYHHTPPPITCFERKHPGSLIIDKGYYFSMCEHHMIPFFGDFFFGYIPYQKEIGASKIGRTIDYFAAKLQTSERLCCQVLERIEEVAEPQGSILIITGRHLCKEMRGLKKYNSPFETIEARGILLENHNGCKDEFLSRIGSRI